MPIASSLVLALAMLARQAPDSRTLLTHARALAKEDPAARAAAEAYVDGLSMTYLGFARSVTAYEPPEVRDAVRRRLPDSLWAGVMDGTIGDVRRSERALLGDAPGWTVASLSKAGTRLLEGSPAERRAGLRLLARAPASDPAALVPALDDLATAHAAAAAIARADEALALRETRRRFLQGPDALARQVAPLLAELGSPDLTPDLAALLRADPSRASDVVSLLEKIGDERAEEALIEWLPRAPVPYGVLRTLSLLGGPRAAAAIRRYRDGLDAGDSNRRWATQALARLREPGLSRELLDDPPWDADLARLGDRTILDEVVARVRGGRLKIQDRKRALELIGILGGEAHVGLLVEHLKEDRFKEAAAAALAEIGDPRAARPLVEALSTASYGAPFVQALARLPLSDAEAPLLALLDDPEENPGVMPDAIALAGRAGGPRMKERLAALMTGRAWSSARVAARALGPLLTAEERDALAARPPEKDARGRQARPGSRGRRPEHRPLRARLAGGRARGPARHR